MPSFRLFSKLPQAADYPKSSLTVVIISLGGLMGVLFQNSLFLNYLWSLIGLTFLAPCVLVIITTALIKRLTGRRIEKWLVLTAVAACSAIISIFVFLAVGSGLDTWKNVSVHNYVARAVPILEDIKTRDGSYPLTLPTSL